MDPRIKLGLERFYEKYPNYPKPVPEIQPEYLGCGAMMVDPDRFTKEP